MFGKQEGERSWRSRLKSLFSRPKGSAIPRQELEALLFEADFPKSIVERLLKTAERTHGESQEAVLLALAQELSASIQAVSNTVRPLPVPGAILLLGVNGAGKTTAAAKLAKRIRDQGRAVLLAAGDTFRAGAIDQLKRWGQSLEIEVVASAPGGDPAAILFDAWQKAVSKNSVLIADTAGRLHTKSPLVDELKKIVKVLGKDGRGAPHESFLVLDGTTGQNALQQSREFTKAAPITGLIITKLDGTARGGASLAASLELSVPIRYLGVGEKAEDLVEFDPDLFARELLRVS